MNPWMVGKKPPNFFTPMDGPPVPQQNHGTPDMLEQLFEKRPNIQTVKVASPEPEIKRQTSPFRRYRQGIDRGNSVLFVKVIEHRGFPPRSPRTTDVGNKQETRLIDEDQMGPKSFGLFLYGAIGKPSNGRSLSRSFAKPGVLASDNSIPFPEAIAIHDWDDTGRQSACEWFGQ